MSGDARHRLYPDRPDRPYGASTFGGTPRGPTLDDLRLVPPIHLPHRLGEVAKYGREPTPDDVRTATTLGGIPAALPFVVPAMGSTPVAHRHGIPLARAAARAGIPLVLGENIATVHGYDERTDPDMPSFKERAMAYLDVWARAGADAPGGLVIQQSVEDAMDELWWRVYTDRDFQPALEAGRIGFEVKVGQGAKPGLGGITLLEPEAAARLRKEYHITERRRPDGRVERQSAPGTFTYAILEAQMRHLRNDFPKARLWVKLPPARDAREAAHAVARGGADLVTLDGAEGGTALAPTVFLEHVGLPTLALLARWRADPAPVPMILAGGLRHGADLAKALSLGAAGVAFGRAPLQAVIAGGEEAADRFFADLADEVRKLTYALGELDVTALDADGVQALDARVAEALGIGWAYAPADSRVPRAHAPSAPAAVARATTS